MNLIELRKYVVHELGLMNDIQFGSPSIHGISIFFKNGEWIVRSSERGEVLEERGFELESEACDYVIQQIDPQTFQPKIE